MEQTKVVIEFDEDLVQVVIQAMEFAQYRLSEMEESNLCYHDKLAAHNAADIACYIKNRLRYPKTKNLFRLNLKAYPEIDFDKYEDPDMFFVDFDWKSYFSTKTDKHGNKK